MKIKSYFCDGVSPKNGRIQSNYISCCNDIERFHTILAGTASQNLVRRQELTKEMPSLSLYKLIFVPINTAFGKEILKPHIQVRNPQYTLS
jgi:hypothetical protein